MKIAYVNEMRELDNRAASEYGIPGEILMENAGQAAYDVILKEFGVNGKKFVVFCGQGNNGGDGLVVARKIHSTGGMVTVFLLGDRSKFRGASRQNLDIVCKLPVTVIELAEAKSAEDDLRGSDAVVDAVFGTGLDREVRGIARDVIDMINASRKKVFSIDIPSGVNGNTGQIMGAAVKADFTITFGLPKIGSVFYPGFELGGKLYATHISFPPALYDSDQLKITVNDPEPIPQRKKDAHKGDFGKVLFIAGSSNYLGAPYFAALSFLKAGGGLSFLAAPETAAAFIGGKGSEIVFLPQKAAPSGCMSLESKDQLLQLSENADMVVLGPGLSLHEETQALVRELCAGIKKPLLIDGDGITAISNDLETVGKREAPTILTPHAGEMARLTKQKTSDVLENRVGILQNTSEKLNAIIVLKGAHSLIGYPDKSVFVNLSGNAGMATAGSGDVLTGTIAAMYGLGFSIDVAARAGVFVHGLAGDLAAKQKGEDGMIAGDIMEGLPASLKSLREDYDSVLEHYRKLIEVI